MPAPQDRNSDPTPSSSDLRRTPVSPIPGAEARQVSFSPMSSPRERTQGYSPRRYSPRNRSTPTNLMPVGGGGDFKSMSGPSIFSNEGQVDRQRSFADHGGPSLLMPMTLAPDEIPEVSVQRHIDNYTMHLGGIPIRQGRPIVTPSKYFYTREE